VSLRERSNTGATLGADAFAHVASNERNLEFAEERKAALKMRFVTGVRKS
jgi:hypothetical protein